MTQKIVNALAQVGLAIVCGGGAAYLIHDSRGAGGATWAIDVIVAVWLSVLCLYGMMAIVLAGALGRAGKWALFTRPKATAPAMLTFEDQKPLTAPDAGPSTL